MEVRACAVFGGIILSVFHERFVGRREIRASAHEVWDKFREFVQNFITRISRRFRLCKIEKLLFVEQIGNFAGKIRKEFFRKFGIFFRVSVEEFFPFFSYSPASRYIFVEMFFNFFGYGERRVVKTEIFAKSFNAFFAERRAVNVGRTCLGRAVTYNRFNDDERGFFGFLFRLCNRFGNGLHIVAVFDVKNLPALRFVTFADVLGKRPVRIAFYGYVVFIVQNDEFSEFKCPRERCRFVFDALHKATVAAKSVSIMVD